MLRTRIILLISAIVLTALLFSLPRVVVDNDPDEVNSETTQNKQQAANSSINSPTSHASSLSDEDQEIILKLKEGYHSSEIKEKSAIFADSLARVFERANMLDSAARYTALAAEHLPGKDRWLNAGNSYYKAFEFAVNPEKANLMGEKAREYLQKALDSGLESPEVKVKIAMTLVSTSNPMQGIMMLREVLKEDPENAEAIYNMGLLSMRSGQYGKAVERFKKLTELQPENAQAHFYLGVSHMENGDKVKAKELFTKVKSLSDDPAVHATVDSYLQEIK